jgi:hypothetical protein
MPNIPFQITLGKYTASLVEYRGVLSYYISTPKKEGYVKITLETIENMLDKYYKENM